ncbi:DUF5133 domain-containing protein [Streptomyces sp. NPDC090106]|uniref:DUF5133 domain-containing protein n=1 Tax=Streptomyces sp. NPDC090106 TaxID=3365946 RepID=UPI00380ECF0B
MLMPLPATLRRLLKEYEALSATGTGVDDDALLAPRAQDLAYTLCVSTGTQEIAHALRVAHDYLDRMIDGTEAVPQA